MITIPSIIAAAHTAKIAKSLYLTVTIDDQEIPFEVMPELHEIVLVDPNGQAGEVLQATEQEHAELTLIKARANDEFNAAHEFPPFDWTNES